MATKQSRCWSGYEPVKGKAPHSQGSCRPKAKSKATASEKKTQQKRKKQLSSWKAEHPGSSRSAAQHLHAPGSKTKKKAVAKSKSKTGAKTIIRKRTASKSRATAKS
jgi:hypothetical protein